MERNKVSYVKKSFAKRSIIAIILSIFALLLFITSMIMGIKSQGKTELNAAAIGFCSMLLSIVAIWYGASSFLEKEKKYILAKCSIGIGSIMIIFWLTMILIGIRG